VNTKETPITLLVLRGNMILTVGAALIILFVFGKAGQLNTEFIDNIKIVASHAQGKQRGIIKKGESILPIMLSCKGGVWNQQFC